MSITVQNAFRRTVEWGGLLVAIALPVCFNPFAERPFEPTKVVLFRWIVAVMATASIAIWVLDRRSALQIREKQPRLGGLSHLFSKNPLTVPLAAYAVVLLLSSVLSVNPRQSLWGGETKHGTLTILGTLLFFMLIEPRLRSRFYAERVITALLAGSVPVALYAVMQFLGLDPLVWNTDSISPTSSTMGRSNFLGAYLAMVIPFTLFRMVSERETISGSLQSGSRRRPQPASVRSPFPLRITVLLLLQTVCVVLSQARAAWLSLIGAVFLFTGTLAYLRRRRSYLLVFTFTLLLGSLLYVGLSRLDLRTLLAPSARPMASMAFSEIREDTVSSRLVIWRCTLHLIPERWLVGHGPENFVSFFGSRCPSEILWGRDDVLVTDPHNIVLEHLFSVGVLGLLAWCAVVGVFFYTAFDTLRRTSDRYDQALLVATLSSAAAFLIQSQFNPVVVVVDVVFWLAVAMGVGRRSYLMQEN